MLMSFEYFDHEWSTISAQFNMISSKLDMFEMLEASTLENEVITLLTNLTSSTLFFISVLLQVVICSLTIGMEIVKGV